MTKVSPSLLSADFGNLDRGVTFRCQITRETFYGRTVVEGGMTGGPKRECRVDAGVGAQIVQQMVHAGRLHGKERLGITRHDMGRGVDLEKTSVLNEGDTVAKRCLVF